jgi:hypothetical protein
MSTKTQRFLFLAGALLAVLVTASILLKRGEGGAGDEPDEGGAGKRITAIKPGSTLPRPEPAGGSLVTPSPVNARTLLGGKAMLEVTPEEVDRILDESGRSAGNLIAAQAILGDYLYLREAAEKEPDNPEVHYWILANRVVPEERREYLKKFKESDPDNALGNYLAAEEAFRSQDIEGGIAELRAAAEKGYRDYSDNLQDDVRQLYAASGKFDDEAIRNGSSRATAMPHVDQIQSLSQRLIEGYQRLQADERPEEAAELVELGIGMLETVAGNSGADAIGSRTMMLFMQEQLLTAAGDPGGDLDGLTAERERVARLGESVKQIFGHEGLLDAAQLDGYAERLHDQGEVGAAEWLVEQVGELPQE